MKLQIEKIKQFFSRKKYVIAAYLFGSLAGASYGAKKQPDIDIALFLSGDNPFTDDLDAKFQLQEEVSKYLNVKESDVDILILNSAPPVIFHDVLKTGRLIYERNKAERVDHEVKKELVYYDTKYMRKIFFKEIEKWVM